MRARVAAAPVARLATVTQGGAPHLVPVCFVLDGDVLYSAVDHKPKRTDRLRRLANVAGEPRVCLLVDHYEEDWSRLWWVRVDGLARELEVGPQARRAAELLAAKYEQYRRSPPRGPVLRIEAQRWRGWAGA